MATDPAPESRLTPRQKEILQLLLNGDTNEQIARKLSIAEGTVKVHVHNILARTGCKNRIELLLLYARSGKQPPE